MASLTLSSAKGSPLTNNEVDGNFTSLNTAKYESGDSPSFATVTTTSTLTVGGGSILSTSAAVAGAGNSQGTATALTKTYNVVTSATAGSAEGVKLPDTSTGLEAFILNDTSATIKIYPHSGESIDSGSANAAIDLGAGHSLRLVGVSATKWNRMSPVVIYNSSGTRVN